MGDSSTTEFFLPWLQGVLAADSSQLDPALETAFGRVSSLIQGSIPPGCSLHLMTDPCKVVQRPGSQPQLRTTSGASQLTALHGIG